ncbi:hypothetical protein AB0M87_27845 [Streptomyces sp. NPDC051320]|uniref:hypothetical protein n=1 Tax=Streptomyces sp. NPDC051320 TaxID=3154644 RepID=UPI003413E883
MSGERPEHDTAIPPRRRSPVVIASVAAAVLLAGGGGAYWAATAADRDGGATGAADGKGHTPPPLALDSTAAGDGGSQGIAPGEPDPSGMIYRAAGPLPDGPDQAPVYRAEGSVTAADVAKLAAAVGVAGTPRLDGTSWKVGTDHDGSGPLLQVTEQAPGTWTLTRFGTGGTDNCPRNKPCSPGTTPGDDGPAVSEKAAKAAAAPVLKALGQDDAKIDAHRVMGSARLVNADPKIGGLPTEGWTTGLRVGPDGKLAGGSGELQAPVKGAVYPLVSAAQALKGLNAPAEGAPRRGGTGGCATTEPLTPDGTSAKKQSDACVPSARTPKPRTVIVDHASLGLAMQLVGGRQTLVPSWIFHVKPTGHAIQPATVTATAVDPKYLVRPAPPGNRNHPGKPDDRKVQSYSTAGRNLTVHFWGGVCSTYTAKASEDAGSVRVTLDGPGKKPGKKICIALAKDLTRTVTLDKPLGDRKVVDTASGETVPQK